MNMRSFTGKFIVFEGIEGVGKTTNINFVADLLKKNNVSLLITREPGGTILGEELRRQLKSLSIEKLSSNTELLLLFAARQQHIDLVIRPALAMGQCVLCDRFTDATYAYQGGGRGVAYDHIAMLEQFVQQDLRPDLTILFVAPVELALQRTKLRGAMDRFEQETHDFFQRTQDAYIERSKMHIEKYIVIDASKSLASIQQQLHNIFTA